MRRRRGCPAWRRQERIVLAVYLTVCALWAWPRTASHESLVALAGAAALVLVPIRRAPWTPTLSWRRAIRIDWGTLVLFGGGIALGRLLFDSGLAEAMGRALVRAAGVEGVWGLTAVAIVTGLLWRPCFAAPAGGLPSTARRWPR